MPRAGRDSYPLRGARGPASAPVLRTRPELIEPCFGHCARLYRSKFHVALLVSCLGAGTAVTDGEPDDVPTFVDQQSLAQALGVRRSDFPLNIEPLVYRFRHLAASLRGIPRVRSRRFASTLIHPDVPRFGSTAFDMMAVRKRGRKPYL